MKKTQRDNKSVEFKEFKELARKLVSVPKAEVETQKAKNEREKGKRLAHK